MGRNEKGEWGLALGTQAQIFLIDLMLFLSLLLMVWGSLQLVVTIFLRVAIIMRYRVCGY